MSKQKGGARKGREESADVKFSKSLSWVLRHGASEVGLAMRPDGFCRLDEVLALKAIQEAAGDAATLENVQRLVAASDKQRFGLRHEDDVWWIRANQGHTLGGVAEEQLLKRVASAEEIPVCLHGTYGTALDAIVRSGGLSKMQRNHMHFAGGLPGEGGVISGMRKTCDVHIYVDAKRAMEGGVVFFISENGVILTSGLDGVLPLRFFSRVVDARTMQDIPLPQPADATTVPASGTDNASSGAPADTQPPQPAADAANC